MPAEVDEHYLLEVGVLGDIAQTLDALAEEASPVERRPDDEVALRQLRETIVGELDESGIAERHEIRTVDSSMVLSALNEIVEAGGPAPSTMGRGPREEPAFFLAAGAAALVAAQIHDAP